MCYTVAASPAELEMEELLLSAWELEGKVHC